MNQKLSIIIILLSLCTINLVEGQDLNTISGSGFNIATGYPAQNGPENTVIMGIQNHYDVNYKWQLVNAHNTNNYYFRSYVYGWGNYYKIWHSGNFSPDNSLRKLATSISNTSSVNEFLNGYTFAYSSSGTPWNGPLLSFGGFDNAYDCQLNSDYGPHGGNHLSFRTRNGDIAKWNSWNEIFHSGNLNKQDVDFSCKNLNANGTIHAREVKVDLNGWSDFVFHPTYKLKPLLEVEKYIKANGHLEDIPSAKEVEKNGVNMGEMQAKLLQKIEELTLYVIELKKENEELQKQINELKK
jgi:hypothetical protein